ncbi:MAG: thermonuclease family protein [Nitrospiraceae bacterium]|nr:thermonuclease family protein [Nitrospiraceae bacterium]
MRVWSCHGVGSSPTATVIANGVNINQLMVKKGFAALYTGTGPRHDWCRP